LLEVAGEILESVSFTILIITEERSGSGAAV
jgi:hypothetical protein